MPASNVYNLQTLASYIDATVVGDGNYQISRLATLTDATEEALSFYVGSRFRAKLEKTRAGCILLSEEDQSIVDGNKLVVKDPYLAYAKLTPLFQPKYDQPPFIHASATIAADVVIGENVTIGPNVVIESASNIGDGAIIGANSYIGAHVYIGSGTLLYPNVTLYSETTVGEHCILHSSCVIGSDGFGFAPSKQGWQKIHQLGRVCLGDYVEIGAGTTVDRGALDDTIIENGVKIDNQVQVGHNVRIGENTAIAAAVAIAGSTVIGKRCTIAGCAGIVGHIEITDDVHITGMTMVSKSILKPGSYSSGVPMNDTSLWRKNAVRFNQLNEMAVQLKSIKKILKI